MLQKISLIETNSHASETSEVWLDSQALSFGQISSSSPNFCLFSHIHLLSSDSKIPWKTALGKFPPKIFSSTHTLNFDELELSKNLNWNKVWIEAERWGALRAVVVWEPTDLRPSSGHSSKPSLLMIIIGILMMIMLSISILRSKALFCSGHCL